MSNLKEQYVSDLDLLLRLEEEFLLLKRAYAAYDEVVLRLKEQGFKEATHAGHTFTLIDNYEEKNTAFRMAFIKRFEIKVKAAK